MVPLGCTLRRCPRAAGVDGPLKAVVFVGEGVLHVEQRARIEEHGRPVPAVAQRCDPVSEPPVVVVDPEAHPGGGRAFKGREIELGPGPPVGVVEGAQAGIIIADVGVLVHFPSVLGRKYVGYAGQNLGRRHGQQTQHRQLDQRTVSSFHDSSPPMDGVERVKA